MAFMPLQQLKLQPRTPTRRFGLTGMTMTNHSTDTKFDLLEQQGVTITATLASIEKELDDMKDDIKGLDNKLDIIIILSVICAFLAQHFH
jgi:hypothetical protein